MSSWCKTTHFQTLVASGRLPLLVQATNKQQTSNTVSSCLSWQHAVAILAAVWGLT